MSSKYSDLDIFLTRNEFVGDISVVRNRNSIRQSIMNIILTRPGEKPFVKSFGYGIHDLLFDNMSPVSYAKMELSMRHSLTNFEPRATITAVEIDGANIDSNSISINIEFTILSGSQSSSVPDSLKIEIKKVR
jgi:uncharacterized protein|tara:strand:- start:4108 stop:4506 length:399 start_codon:yes stop_codon:yes gene_type:complete